MILPTQNKSALRGGKAKCLDYFLHRGIRNKKLGNFKNFQVWGAFRFFEQRATTAVRPPPHALEGKLLEVYATFLNITFFSISGRVQICDAVEEGL